jgi:hypothetical protein
MQAAVAATSRACRQALTDVVAFVIGSNLPIN